VQGCQLDAGGCSGKAGHKAGNAAKQNVQQHCNCTCFQEKWQQNIGERKN
jgi:hypothetical protein